MLFKTSFFTVIVNILLAFLCLQTLNAQQIRWPDHKKAVIVLTYDDALESQLNNAVPQLNAAHLTGTFFLTGDVTSSTITKWRAVAAKGNELANHTLYHPCLSASDSAGQLTPLERYTPAIMIREIAIMNNLLFAIDGKTTRTYAYPCTDTLAGGRSYIDTLRHSGLVKYARLGGDTDNAVITKFRKLDRFEVPAYGLEGGNSGAELIKFAKKVLARGGIGIFMFHGVGGDYISVTKEAHQQLVNYLAAHRDVIWVTTFQKAMDYVDTNVKRQSLR